jgi:hypothetical protein
MVTSSKPVFFVEFTAKYCQLLWSSCFSQTSKFLWSLTLENLTSGYIYWTTLFNMQFCINFRLCNLTISDASTPQWNWKDCPTAILFTFLTLFFPGNYLSSLFSCLLHFTKLHVFVGLQPKGIYIFYQVHQTQCLAKESNLTRDLRKTCELTENDLVPCKIPKIYIFRLLLIHERLQWI